MPQFEYYKCVCLRCGRKHLTLVEECRSCGATDIEETLEHLRELHSPKIVEFVPDYNQQFGILSSATTLLTSSTITTDRIYRPPGTIAITYGKQDENS